MRNVDDLLLVLDGLGLEERKPEGEMSGGEGRRGADKGREHVMGAFSFECFRQCQGHACNYNCIRTHLYVPAVCSNKDDVKVWLGQRRLVHSTRDIRDGNTEMQ